LNDSYLTFYVYTKTILFYERVMNDFRLQPEALRVS
jgi:hypothetical protein